jgi:plastocyanin
MRQHARAAVAAALLLVACGGAETSTSDSAEAPAALVVPSSPTGAVESPVLEVPVQPGMTAPITGAIIEVRMIGDARGYRFVPQHVTAKPGDGVKFVVVSGGPHEIAFDLEAIPAESRDRLQVNMPNSTNGRSPLLISENETWTVSLGALKAGKYPFVSTPRLPQGMKGEIEIQ